MNYHQQHGSLNIRWLTAQGIDPKSLHDFSVNINPFPVSPKVRAALSSLDPSQYPDPSVHYLKSLLVLKNQANYHQVLIGNGAAELIWLITQALWRRRKVLLVTPTFGEYKRAAQSAKAKILEWTTKPPTFNLELDAFFEILCLQSPQFTVICNPNNPTGTWLEDTMIKQLAAAYPDITFIIDESYRSFVTGSPFSPPLSRNVIHLRSLTKDFALAGLRIGYLLADASIVNQLQSIQPPWSVNAAAQIAAAAAIHDLDYVLATIKQVKEETLSFSEQLKQTGANVHQSSTHYFLIDVAPCPATIYWEKLLQKSIHVRDCTSFGLPHHIRISTKLPHQNRLFIEAWKSVSHDLSGR